MKRTVITVVAAILLLAVPALFATPISGFNPRPTTIYPTCCGESALPAILAAMGSFTGAPQSNVGMWMIPGANPNFSPTLQFEFAANANTNTFGIWTAYDTGGPVSLLPIFMGSAVNGDIAGVRFNSLGQIQVADTYGSGHVVSTGGYVNAGINPGFFGFYLGTGAGAKYYTIDALNAPTNVNGSDPPDATTNARALVYHSTDTSNRWALAFEDGTDFDYNDMVVTIESITPVPEPASMFLLGSGLIGAASFLRRRSAARK